MTITQEATSLTQQFVDTLRAGVTPATGCTEPVSLAYAAACAARRLDGPIDRIDARVSPNLMKNGMGVMVPGTGTAGLVIAAAVGAAGGDPQQGLQILATVPTETVDQAKALISEGKVQVGIAPVPDPVWSEATVTAGGHQAVARVIGGHTNLTLVTVDGETVHESPAAPEEADDHDRFLRSMTLRQIHDIVDTIDLEQIAFIDEAGQLNDRLAEEGLHGEYGLRLGTTLADGNQSTWWDEAEAWTAAASDARMGGASMPAMTNSGSGNQGITATVPVTVTARHVGADREQRIRALALSHATALYAHAFLPKLSAFCAAATAGMGAAAGMCRLLDGGYEASARALSTMGGDLMGMVCDGAAPSCAMKVASSVTSATRAVRMALQGLRVSGDEGLVSDDVDETIRNIGHLTCHGMKCTDEQILTIMTSKNQGA